MKYNPGDKVLDKSDLNLLFNPFWKEQYRKSLIQTVTEANENYFSIYKPGIDYKSAIEEGLSCGMNEYMIFHQHSGHTKNWASNKTLLHVEKDKGQIISYIKELGEKTFQHDNTFIENQIKAAEYQKEKLRKTYEEDLKKNLEIIEGVN